MAEGGRRPDRQARPNLGDEIDEAVDEWVEMIRI
jgi:hypothetical protein